MDNGANKPLQQDENPPLFKSWRDWYWLVISVLAAQIIVFYLITRSFS